MAGRLPTTIKNVEIERAERAHKCRRDSSHPISKGDVRLAISVDRETHRYCIDCARRALALDVEKLNGLIAALS
jgi:hypothetical protein